MSQTRSHPSVPRVSRLNGELNGVQPAEGMSGTSFLKRCGQHRSVGSDERQWQRYSPTTQRSVWKRSPCSISTTHRRENHKVVTQTKEAVPRWKVWMGKNRLAEFYSILLFSKEQSGTKAQRTCMLKTERYVKACQNENKLFDLLDFFFFLKKRAGDNLGFVQTIEVMWFLLQNFNVAVAISTEMPYKILYKSI